MRKGADWPRVDVFPQNEAAIGSQFIQLPAAVRGVVGTEPQCIVERGQRGRVGVTCLCADRYRGQVRAYVRPLRHAAIVSQLEQLTAVGGSLADEPQCTVENGHIDRL